MKEQVIAGYLRAKGFPELTEISEAQGYWVVVMASIIGQSGKIRPTRRQIGRWEEHLTQVEGIETQIHVIPEVEHTLQRSITTALSAHFPDINLHVVVPPSLEGKIEPTILVKHSLASNQDLKSLEKVIRNLLASFPISDENIDISIHSETSRPPNLVILQNIRHLSPVVVEELETALNKAYFIGHKDLKNAIDQLRKSGYIVRTHDGMYAMTLLGLTVLGTERDSPRPPDIRRLLAIGNKKRDNKDIAEVPRLRSASGLSEP